MNIRSCIALLLCASGPLSAQDLQHTADSLPIQQPADSDKRIRLPEVKGAEIQLLGADYEQIVNSKGHISKPLTDTSVRLSFKLTKGAESVISKDYEILIPGKAKGGSKEANPKPRIIPELLNWNGGVGQWELPRKIQVYGDAGFIPELMRELHALLPEGYSVSRSSTPKRADIVFRLSRGEDDECYGLTIDKNGVCITAAGVKGLFWGSRTLLQMLAQTPTALPKGMAWDAPRYTLRGFMLDVGRLPIPMDYLKDVVRLMAWYKMNDLQLHLNDNYIFHEHYVDAGEVPFRESYSAFRMESSIKGKDGTPLTAQDLFYTKSQFRELVQFAKARGVSIVPEFDAPGHALSLTRVRPDLIYQGPMKHEKRRCEMLDAANPETLRFVGSIWDEYLTGTAPAFEHCPVVHVGSDEFFGEAEDYRRFADGLLGHIQERKHTPRIWGSLKAKPGKTPVRAKGVQMNLWSRDWASAWDSVNSGYDVITTCDRDLYVVPFASYYRADLRLKHLYEKWQPNQFVHETLPAGHPQLLGAAFAIWNDEIDRLHRGYGACDLWQTISSMTATLSRKMWGQPDCSLPYEEHHALADKLNRIPYCNPQHKNGESFSLTPGLTPMRLGKGSKGPDYHLSMELLMPEAPVPGEEQVLLSSSQGQVLAAGKDGRIILRRSDSIEFAYNVRLPIGRRAKLELIGRMGRTELLIDGINAGEPENLRFPLRREGLMSTFVLPLEYLGSSFNGKVYSLEVR